MVKKIDEKDDQGPAEPIQVFVNGIPYDSTEETLKEFFGELASGITLIKMPRY